MCNIQFACHANKQESLCYFFSINAIQMKHLLKRNNKEIPSYLRDKQLNVPHSASFDIIQQPTTITMTKTKKFCFIETETNRCLMFDATLCCSLAKALSRGSVKMSPKKKRRALIQSTTYRILTEANLIEFSSRKNQVAQKNHCNSASKHPNLLCEVSNKTYTLPDLYN